eukprot:gnl/TRDRNA2_/TRDRNA2_171322_c0_seq3.p1 gnl/TRDRNA2_/TRDRNA2_171322_c0~~gnl/TRDRNA2_/TRDRNA2_171322_c0_seq3.p1  ORF type:complete len:291 (-),score=30.82 gnl/TRDRNA2_/TRDRNA2_171322_c0_seq3:82-891(-)
MWAYEMEWGTQFAFVPHAVQFSYIDTQAPTMMSSLKTNRHRGAANSHQAVCWPPGNWSHPHPRSVSSFPSASYEAALDREHTFLDADPFDSRPSESIFCTEREQAEITSFDIDDDSSAATSFSSDEGSCDSLVLDDDELDDDVECDGILLKAGNLSPVQDADGTIVETRELKTCDPARLSHLLTMKSSGWSSIGSMNHWRGEGGCKPCSFQSRYLKPARHSDFGKPPCFKGLLCDRCHEHHESTPKSKKKGDGDTEKLVWAYKPRKKRT